jgi:hypothetical protein
MIARLHSVPIALCVVLRAVQSQQIAAGYLATCVISESGVPRCFGEAFTDGFGVPFNTTFVQIIACKTAFCGITTAGNYCVFA